MQDFSDECISMDKLVDFGCIPVDTVIEKTISIENMSENFVSYRAPVMYVLDNIDRVFKVTITSTPVKPGDCAVVRILFRPKIPGQSFTEYYVIDDTAKNQWKLTVTGTCSGPKVSLNKRRLIFMVSKNITENRRAIVKIVNKSSVDTTYQWLMPLSGQGYFQISRGNCGLIRAHETITTNVVFSGTALGLYTAELVCLVLNQEPLFLNVLATVVLPGHSFVNIKDHIFEEKWKRESRSEHLMENSLNRLTYIPSASVFERYLDFGTGSVSDITLNISQTLCVTNHEQEEGYMQWVPDPDNIFLIDPIESMIPPNESRLFTIRFRPKLEDEVYGHLMCGDFQFNIFDYDDTESVKVKHMCFRIPCIGNTWSPCTEWTTDWDCPTEVTLPPTVPARTTYTNFMLSNKLDIPMYYKFEAPHSTNFVVLPMCGIVQSRGWQIITVALEPKSFGHYLESWDLVINKVHKARLSLCGTAEISQVEVMSHGYNPAAHAMYEFPPTITGCTNYCTAYLHNLTRMNIHIRVLNSVSWLGADNYGSIILQPKEIMRYHWWFFPKTPNKVYGTTITCSCICLIDNKPVGEPTEIFINITGYSELPDLRVLPKSVNLNDIVVGESMSVPVTLYNNDTCYFTSKLYHITNGMGDDFSGDLFEIDSTINSLKPSNHCEVKFTVTPKGGGPRQVDIKYTVLYRTDSDEIDEIMPVTKTICIVWYDGIYPTLKIKRTISVKCPIILSNHCVWNIVNVEELNKAFVECRPNKPLTVNLYAPELCLRPNYNVEFVFVVGCIYNAPVPWNLRREKLCDCEMVEVKVGISTYEMRHTCIHRPLVELSPNSGIVTADSPNLLFLKFNYAYKGQSTLCYVITMPNQRTIYLRVNLYAHLSTKGILTPLRRPIGMTEYLAVMDCGRVPINNLDPVIRIVWLYNPTDVFTTWRLLQGNTISTDSVIRCLLYFAEVPPLGKLAIPFAFMPTEMVDYKAVFNCSFGYETEKILVKGQGGLPNCVETRLDIPTYTERVIRAAYRKNVVYLSMEHLTLPMMVTHSLSRDIIAICNDTASVIRFIWLPAVTCDFRIHNEPTYSVYCDTEGSGGLPPSLYYRFKFYAVQFRERIANIINIVMTPCWGVIQPKGTVWITMTVYTLQEPATFTTTVACEILDLTERKRYHRNELLRRKKIEKCKQEFIIIEQGTFHPGINDEPPYVLDIEKPQPFYLSMTVSISSKGQRDGYSRMLLKQIWEQTPPYDLLSSDLNDHASGNRSSGGNSMTMDDIIRIIDCVLWEALHSKLFKNQILFYSKEEMPTHSQLVKVIETATKPRLSRRVTSGICDAIVNKAVFHVYDLNSKHESTNVMEAE